MTIFLFFQCIDTAAGYTAHLGLLLASPDTELMEICAEIPLMTRIQVMGKGDWDIDPLTLRCPTCYGHSNKILLISKYGSFWSFASGVDVASNWLRFAKEAKGDRGGFTERALLEIGFGRDQIDLTGNTR